MGLPKPKRARPKKTPRTYKPEELSLEDWQIRRFGFFNQHRKQDEGGRVIGYRNLGRISQTLEPIMIRRTKQEVLKELPERIEKQLFVRCAGCSELAIF
jgi:hypothetical protein